MVIGTAPGAALVPGSTIPGRARAPSLATTINCQIWTVEGSAAALGGATSAALDWAVPAVMAHRRGSQHESRRHLGAPCGPEWQVVKETGGQCSR